MKKTQCLCRLLGKTTGRLDGMARILVGSIVRTLAGMTTVFLMMPTAHGQSTPEQAVALYIDHAGRADYQAMADMQFGLASAIQEIQRRFPSELREEEINRARRREIAALRDNKDPLYYLHIRAILGSGFSIPGKHPRAFPPSMTWRVMEVKSGRFLMTDFEVWIRVAYQQPEAPYVEELRAELVHLPRAQFSKQVSETVYVFHLKWSPDGTKRSLKIVGFGKLDRYDRFF